MNHPGMTFLRRAETIQLDMVTDRDVATTLRETMDEGGKQFDEAGLMAATALTRGYPYLIQAVGSLLWAQAEIAHHNQVTADTVAKIHDDVIYRMGHQVHRPALAHLSERELDFLHHMAALGPEPANTSKIADRMGLKANVASQTRAKLLNRELIAVPARGKVEFTLPYLREYLLEGRIP